ncbi:acylphosphatase [Lentibacillus cibarius]|uniref:Acylphosphatase n=1 Tax=Lentibacillus cibarius TaxID=2583219 RepID=A0A549YKW3_9BACI|nr:acylphosphatase [Lentibacillus cibarius]TMN23686.1 acylphosphatase [Lentibacillus cibarius]TRM12518.1 acylphosphatase [Lentibacillus cibarius]
MLAQVTVSGRVQGVGFRYSAQQQAKNYQLTGWVQNKADGTVELEVEGDEQRVHAYLRALEKGFSPFIRVENMEVNLNENEKGYDDFSIK